MVSKDHQWSLTRAGINAAFHDKKLSDFGREGAGLFKWMNENRVKLKIRGGGVLINSLSSGDLVTMLGKTMHMNGAAAYVTQLARIGSVLYDDKVREVVEDAHVLCITGFQRERAESPLKPSVQDDCEALIGKFLESNKLVCLGVPIDGSKSPEFDTSLLTWWSGELAHKVSTKFDCLNVQRLTK